MPSAASAVRKPAWLKVRAPVKSAGVVVLPTGNPVTTKALRERGYARALWTGFELTADDFDLLFTVDVRAAFLLTQEVARRKPGRPVVRLRPGCVP